MSGPTGLATAEKLLAAGNFSELKSLLIIDIPKSDLSWVSECTSLEWLLIEASSSNPVDIRKLKNLRRIEINAKAAPSITGIEHLPKLDEIKLRSPKSEDLARLGGNAKRLKVFGPPAEILNFVQTETLEALWVANARKAEVSVAGIASLRGLKELAFYSLSKGIINSYSLDSLNLLEKVQFDNVTTVDDMGWLIRLPMLNDLYVSRPLPYSEDDHELLIHRGLVFW